MAKKHTREIHTPSPTAIAAEALRTGVAPRPKTPIPPIEIPREQRDRRRPLLEVPDRKE